MNSTDTPFLDVPALLERSLPRWQGHRVWYAAGLFVLIVMVSVYFGNRGTGPARVVEALSSLSMVVLIIVMGFLSWATVRRARAAQAQLEAAEELIRLRRWAEAAGVLRQMLNQPARTPQTRVQALIYLTGVLARYDRFDDAILVQDHLLQTVPLDPGTVHGLKLARAMAMLRQDRLFDADRAISELRRQVGRYGRASAVPVEAGDAPAEPAQTISAGLALIEIYRDVKTGHPAEAVEIFDRALPALREQLGHRVADAYMLAARAYDLLNRPTEAQTMYENATLLMPPPELHRRYPETETLCQKYQPAAAPKEAA